MKAGNKLGGAWSVIVAYIWRTVRGGWKLVIGASAASPTLVVKTVYMVRAYSVYIHPAPFVRDAIFPHCKLVM